jgi:hypothetical protein
VIVERVTRSHVAWMTSIDGLQPLEVIEESLTIPEHEARRLVRALLAAGALDDAARIPDALRWASRDMRDVSAGRFGAAVSTYRDIEAAYRATSRREGCSVAIVGAGPVADQLRTSIDASGMSANADHPDLVVFADASHPDVPATFDHPLQDLPHLHLGVLGARAVVGPLVVPGQTSCLRCAHLHRRDADSAWPLLAVQWAHAVAAMAVRPVDPLLAHSAAVQATLLIRTWVDRPDAHDAWADLAYEIVLPEGRIHVKERPPHPLCGCQWASQ